MSDLRQHTEQFLKRGKEQLQKRQDEAWAKINDNLEAYREHVKTSDVFAAMADWGPEMESRFSYDVLEENKMNTSASSVVPEYLRYGDMKMVSLQGEVIDGLNIPLLLPTKVNAVLLDLGDDAGKVPNLFQNIIVRLLLSMRMDLVKVSVVDMDLGRSFPIAYSSINNKMYKKRLVADEDEVKHLIADLKKEIIESNSNFMGRFPDIDAYNASAGEMAQPYHFVFIDDFPKGFNSQSIDTLLRLIDNGNASGVGVKIFINYSEKNLDSKQLRDFDLQLFKRTCSLISKDESGRFVFDNWPLRFPLNLVPILDLELPEKVNEYVDFINKIEQKEVIRSLDKWIEDLKRNNEVWSGDTSYGINVPIGFKTSTEKFYFCLANDMDSSCNDFFALVAGGPGSGKTVFLHNLIVNAAMMYSPDDLIMYLVDFSPEGASFRIYRELPHVKSLLLSNNKEYVLRMLEDLEKETVERAKNYEKLAENTNQLVDKLSIYRKLADNSYPKMPRVLLIMDELQGLLTTEEYSPVVRQIKEKLDNGIKQWRKFGINVVLCTQTFRGVDIGSAKELASYRFALKLPEDDSNAVIRNRAAASIYVKGQTIMNNTNDGRVDMNVVFQSAYSEHYSDDVQYLAQLYQQRYDEKPVHYICQSSTKANVAENLELISHFEDDDFEMNHSECDVFVGKPDLLRNKHTRIKYRRQLHSNTIIIGDDYKTLILNVAVQLIQLMKQSDTNSKFYILDCFNAGDKYKDALNGIKALSSEFIIGNTKNVEEFIDKLTDDLEQRKNNAQTEVTKERAFLVLINTQNCHQLRLQGHRPSRITEKLKTILLDGAPLGMHAIVHVHSYNSMFGSENVFETSDFSLFENVIFLKGSDVDKTSYRNLKIEAPDKSGRMIVINAKCDEEEYEQCNSYSDITVDGKMSPAVECLFNLFKKYQ